MAAVLPRGTVGVIADPHEKQTSQGSEVYVLEDTPEWSKIRYTAPSCVPATHFETSGVALDPIEVKELLKREEIVGLRR